MIYTGEAEYHLPFLREKQLAPAPRIAPAAIIVVELELVPNSVDAVASMAPLFFELNHFSPTIAPVNPATPNATTLPFSMDWPLKFFSDVIIYAIKYNHLLPFCVFSLHN